ncbi:MAG: hypothetical protein L3J04_07665 [Robiginitomaculum sp.]|nr:hypothetical protein [Robiginitomaculum sp.]
MIKPLHKYLFLMLFAAVIFSTAPIDVAAQSPDDTKTQDDAPWTLKMFFAREDANFEFLSQETQILAELEQKNTKARRDLLAWLRHDHAIVLANYYKTLKGEDYLEQALNYSQSATEIAPQTVQFWKTFGLINLTAKMGMISDIQAEGSFRRVLELDSKDTEARLMLVGILLKNKEYKEAAEHYAILFKQNPEVIIASDLHKMNLTFISADVAGWGIEIYDAYLKKYPGNGKVLIAKSILLKADGYDAQALRLLGEALSSNNSTQQIKTTARNLLAHWKG